MTEKKAEQNPPFDFFGLATFSLGMIGLQMLLDRGERLEWFASPEIWWKPSPRCSDFYLYVVHVLTARAHFLNKALFKDRNFVLSTIMYFASGFVLLPTLALTSPMLEELFNYPVDTTGYMTIPRGITLVGGLVLMQLRSGTDRQPAASCSAAWPSWSMPIGGCSVIRPPWIGGRWSWRARSRASASASLMPALTKTAFSTLDPKFRPEGTALFNLSRFYGSTIGIAVVQVFFYNNTQAVYLALAKNLTPYRAAAHARFDVQAGARRAQRLGHRPGGRHRSHRSVRDSGVRHADRQPARPVSPQTAPGQLTLVEPVK